MVLLLLCDNSNTVAKVLAMWMGEIGFEATFRNVTSVDSYEKEK